MKTGGIIQRERTRLGLSQEKLAEQVGVSRQAVSKWETDASYPDVALLCPLARALNTTVDALLQFEAALTDEEVARQINALMETLPQKGADACEEELRRLVQEVLTRDDIKYCPHGRPVCVTLTKRQLEKQFKRV